MTNASENENEKTFLELISAAPLVHDRERAERNLSDLFELCRADAALAPLAATLETPAAARLLQGIFGASPYLTRLILRRPDALRDILLTPPRVARDTFSARAAEAVSQALTRDECMRALRRFKAEMALLVAMADLGSVWPVMTVTQALTETADTAVQLSLRYLFREAQQKGDWQDSEPHAEARSGYFIIAMGKHGALELNYSSDIDLVVFFEPSRARTADRIEKQTFFIKLTRELVKFMQEHTADGYVFRTDLRLRPDPGATPVALSVDAAHIYYESVGQNWERAAYIKARVIAGDLDAGRKFLGELAPYVWRKYLDFAAIADIHAMKRQIHAAKGFGQIAVAGHDIKVGRGGIREIEFFAQTQQLIAGGRQPDLRVPATLDALDRLVARSWLKPAIRDELAESYRFLRRIEHRLQMLDDEQTQRLPSAPAELERLAHFSGFATLPDFETALTQRLRRVQSHYAQLFEDSPTLTATAGSMVFTGATDDPETVAALRSMRYHAPSRVIESVRGWHHGRIRAIRSPRARELLTEVQPVLIEALSHTADPDGAFAAFDRFLSDLPSGVQLFSLLRQNPALLELVASIMGTAPRLARVLSRHARLLDAVLDPGFFGAIAEADALASIVKKEMAEARSLEEALDRARIVGSEQGFLIGVRVLTGTISAADAGRAYATLADELIAALAERVEHDMIAAHGRVPGGAAAVIAMGKLGGREMTASSDLDLIVVYDFDPDASQSDGRKPLAAIQYYNRFTQRLINAFTAQTAEGALYEIDMRLRPSGQKGPVATQFSSFVNYQTHEAWTWEHLALTRARIVAGPPELTDRLSAAIRDTLTRTRDRAKTASDVREMRARIAEAKGGDDVWDLKQARGGLVDLEFIAQHLQLVHAAHTPAVLDQNTIGAFQRLRDAEILNTAAASDLMAAARLHHNLTQVLRLSLDGVFRPDTAPDGLKALLASAGAAPTFSALEAEVRSHQARVAELFEALVQ